jgi:hypothetical protein
MKMTEHEAVPTKEKTPGEQKVDEYVARALRGVPLSDILQDLGPHFTSEILRKLRGQSELPDFLREELSQLGYAEEDNFSAEGATDSTVETDAESQLNELVESAVGQFKNEAAKNLIREQYERRSEPGYRRLLASSLFSARYRGYREADYPIDKNEQQIWEHAVQDKRMNHIEQNEWTYRGIFPEKERGKTTETRASLNVALTPELLAALDALIEQGELVGNYKFGEPGTGASALERHDSITLYFLEEPSEEVLKKISELAQPYVRGNNLLGKKIAEGFYVSEIGSVQEEHIKSFVEELQDVDPEFSQAINEYVTRKDNKGLGMSEAQYYAVKDVAEAFGYNLEYDGVKGFALSIKGKDA